MKASPHNPAFAIETIDLMHRYGSYLAVDKLNLKVETGSIFGLIGSNGAGKSTTIKMLTTLLPVTSGQAFVDGYDVVTQPSDVRQNIGYVPQLISADGELTGYENLLLSAKLYGLSYEQRQTRIIEVMDFMNIGDVIHKSVSGYSGGMIRSLEIAQALIHQPHVIFLDEPTVGLDPAARKVIWRYLQRLNKEIGTTILMTTHDMDEADALCHKVALLHGGQIAIMDTPTNLKAKVGPKATLDDVFILHTGSSLKETGDYSHVKQTRTTISNL